MSRARRVRFTLLLSVWLLLVSGVVGPAGSAHAGSVAAASAPAGPTGASATGFVPPVPPPPVVLVPFAPPPNRFGAGHRGADLAAGDGTVIVAAGPGRVVFAGTVVDRGVVSVEHEGGLRTTYEPLTASVTAGAVVAAGQPIGTVQPSHPPCAPATCLHWGARLPDGTYLDPMALLDPWRVRLWPWDGR